MLAANNPFNLEIFRFDNLEFLGELVSRTRMEDAEPHNLHDGCDRELRAILRFNAMRARLRSTASYASSERLVEPKLAGFYRQKMSKQQDLVIRGEAYTRSHLASAACFRILMIDEDFRTVLKAEMFGRCPANLTRAIFSGTSADRQQQALFASSTMACVWSRSQHHCPRTSK
jgi:hypothetical protein